MSYPWSESVLRPNLCALWNWWPSKGMLVSSLWNVENVYWFKLIYNTEKIKFFQVSFGIFLYCLWEVLSVRNQQFSVNSWNRTSSSTLQNPHSFDALCWFLTMLIIFENECKECLLPLTTPCFPLKLDSPVSVSSPSFFCLGNSVLEHFKYVNFQNYS